MNDNSSNQRTKDTIWHRFLKAHGGAIIKDLIVVVLLGTWLGIWIETRVHMREQVHYQESRDFDDIVEKLRIVGYEDEMTYNACQQLKKGEIGIHELQEINRHRNYQFIYMLSKVRTLQDHHQMQNKDFWVAVIEFSRWNNELYKLGMKVCEGPLKNELELRVWVDSIVSLSRPVEETAYVNVKR